MNGRIFVSYATSDRPRADTYATWLEEAGLEVWLDWREVSEGADWEEQVRNGIARCDLFVGIASTGYFKSEGFKYEMPDAASMGRTTLAVWEGPLDCAEAHLGGFTATARVATLSSEAEKQRFLADVDLLLSRPSSRGP